MLWQASAGRAADAPLFDKQTQIREFFRVVADRPGLDPEVTPYALRHSSMVRMLLAAVPVQVVAAHLQHQRADDREARLALHHWRSDRHHGATVAVRLTRQRRPT
jgi:integrase